VAALDGHVTFETVSIVPEEDAWGRVASRLPKWFHPDRETNDRHRNYLEVRVIMMLAGPEVERRMTGRYNRVGAESDWRGAHSLTTHLSGNDAEADAYLRWLVMRTRTLVRFPPYWQRVKTVADALLDHEVLRYRRVKAIVADATDGW
jgi:hypothetical protein